MVNHETSADNPAEQENKVHASFIAFVRQHISCEFPAGEGEAATTYKAKQTLYTPTPLEEITFSIDKLYENPLEWGMYSIALRAHDLDIYKLMLEREKAGETRIFAILDPDELGEELGEQGTHTISGFQASVTQLLDSDKFIRA